MAIRISSALLARIVGEAGASPHEVCGLLFGTSASIEAAEPCRNVAADTATRFEIDPARLLRAHRAARAGGPQLIGCYHSHPGGEATPSREDATCAEANGWLWLIVGGREAQLYRAIEDGVLHGRFSPVAITRAAFDAPVQAGA
jgi:proteasome lid subunit RPN8/RPN11